LVCGGCEASLNALGRDELMLPYWLLFMIPAWNALHQRRMSEMVCFSPREARIWRGIFWLLVLMVGFRYHVGGDWYTYELHLSNAANLSLGEGMALKGDPAYGLLNWLAARWGGVLLANVVCGLVFAWGLVAFCRVQPRPWLALTVAVPYLITVVGMGYTRQGAAVGLEMLGFVTLGAGRLWRYLLLIGCAALFHKSAVVMAPMALLAASRHRFLTMLLVGLMAFVLYRLMLEDSMDRLIHGYIDAGYSSSGAAIRVAMNALPAGLFLLFRRRFELSPAERGFWTLMALSALGFVVLLNVLASSTAVDRVALYWIPLQLFVWSRIPDVLWHWGGSKKVWNVAVVAYSGVVHFVWLNYADHARYWLPYQFYPWVAFWE